MTAPRSGPNRDISFWVRMIWRSTWGSVISAMGDGRVPFGQEGERRSYVPGIRVVGRRNVSGVCPGVKRNRTRWSPAELRMLPRELETQALVGGAADAGQDGILLAVGEGGLREIGGDDDGRAVRGPEDGDVIAGSVAAVAGLVGDFAGGGQGRREADGDRSGNRASRQ